MYIKLEETVSKTFYKKVDEASTAIPTLIRNEVEDFSQQSVKNMINKFYLPKHGRVYVLPDGGLHVASAEGESPARITGALMESIHYEVKSMSDATELLLGYGEWYGLKLETTMYRPNIIDEFEEAQTLLNNALRAILYFITATPR